MLDFKENEIGKRHNECVCGRYSLKRHLCAIPPIYIFILKPKCKLYITASIFLLPFVFFSHSHTHINEQLFQCRLDVCLIYNSIFPYTLETTVRTGHLTVRTGDIHAEIIETNIDNNCNNRNRNSKTRNIDGQLLKSTLHTHKSYIAQR